MLGDSKFPGLLPREPEPNPFIAAASDLKKAFSEAKQILILVADNPKLDYLASALGLYLALSKSGKTVTIACPTPMRVEFNRLVGVDKVAGSIGSRNLIISFPYQKDSIEKVSYNVDDANFNLVIQPKDGFPNLDSDKVSYSYSGAEADLVFIIGAPKLENLSHFYDAEKKLFETATLINIDSSPMNTKYARINIVWNEYSSCSEAVVELLEILGFGLSEDIATNLLAGLNQSTQNFQRFNIKPKAFEVASKLMQAGAKRLPSTPAFDSSAPGSQMQIPPFGVPDRFPSYASEFMRSPSMTGYSQPTFPSPPTPFTPQVPFNPQSLPTPSTGEVPLNPSSVLQGSTPQSQVTDTSQPDSQPDVNKDWLKPKIFKGSSKV